MAKRNKLRYQSRGNQFPPIIMTGTLYLRHRDDEVIPKAVRGDLQIFLSTDSLPGNINVGDYDSIGLEGYLKADVYDGKEWRPLSLEEFFSHREYYFGKRERPIDVFNLCEGVLRANAGTSLLRIYREHYVKSE